jgi:hypothetical protein
MKLQSELQNPLAGSEPASLESACLAGGKHPLVAQSLSNRAALYRQTQQFAEAERVFQTETPDHPANRWRVIDQFVPNDLTERRCWISGAMPDSFLWK